jgi:hypothetical protein
MNRRTPKRQNSIDLEASWDDGIRIASARIFITQSNWKSIMRYGFD